MPPSRVMLFAALVGAALCAPAAAKPAHNHILKLMQWMRPRAAGAPCDPTYEVCIDPFIDELPLPRVIKPEREEVDEEGHIRHHYEVTMGECTPQLHSQLPPTPMYCYDGTYPGPSFEAKSGIPIVARFINKLPSEHLLPVDLAVCDGVSPDGRAVVHLHGGHQEWTSDGDAYAWWTASGKVGPDAPSDPGLYTWANSRTPAPLFYHDHAACVTRLNVYAGLQGLYNLRDKRDTSVGCDGVSEFPLVLRDIALNPDATLAYPTELVPEMFGNVSLVNGAAWPKHTVPAGKVKYRLLNGANSRFYNLRVYAMNAEGGTDLTKPGPSFVVTGVDGGALDRPVKVTDSLLVGPAERYDFTLDFSGLDGGWFVLYNDAGTPYSGPGDASGDEVPLPLVMAFHVSHREAVPRPGSEVACPAPARSLRAVAPVEPPFIAANHLATEVAPLRPADRLIDMREYEDAEGRLMLLLEQKHCAEPVNIFPQLFSTECWDFINTTPDYHPMHIHQVDFQIIGSTPFDVDGYLATGEVVYTGPLVPPSPQDAGPKDMVKVPVGVVTRVCAKFDLPGLWMFHCHILEHEDYDMMRFFTVVPSAEQVLENPALGVDQAKWEAVLKNRPAMGASHMQHHPVSPHKGGEHGQAAAGASRSHRKP